MTYRNSPKRFRMVPSPTPYGLPFLDIGVCHLATPLISGTGKATDFKFGGYIYRANLNKSPLKILEKMERGRIQRLPNFLGVPLLSRDRIKLRTTNLAGSFIGSVSVASPGCWGWGGANRGSGGRKSSSGAQGRSPGRGSGGRSPPEAEAFLPREATRSAVLPWQVVRPSVCPSLTLRYRDHIGWNSAKIISRLISLTFSLSADPYMTHLLQREHPKY